MKASFVVIVFMALSVVALPTGKLAEKSSDVNRFSNDDAAQPQAVGKRAEKDSYIEDGTTMVRYDVQIEERSEKDSYIEDGTTMVRYGVQIDE
ncbi:hypothetical protein EUX98_g3330 [Antrodiella citrinella]|uniref:Uncharacterized protein n=1 Tax=Antrodiella citrinella TaxID=2447956 RepID=A0A4S4MWU8_9APHY|nr:hypothetical protein EUX98_g3330 [Antrodiella citrinella]